MRRVYRRGGFFILLSFLTILSGYVYAGSIDSITNVVVLQENDPFPSKATMLNTVDIKGWNGNSRYSYFEMMREAKKMAAIRHANVIKVLEHKLDGKDHSREQVKVAFYLARDNRLYEKQLDWEASRRLTWADFKGPIPRDAEDNTAAATFCGIGFQTNNVLPRQKPKVYVYNTFYANESWVRPGERTPEILAHEQGHFDICELYTRLLRQKIGAAKLTSYNLKITLNNIYSEINRAYESRQQDYERDTDHGLDSAAQHRWQQQIALELLQSAKWADSDN